MLPGVANGGDLDEGLYESVVTPRLVGRLDRRPELIQDIADVDEADQPHVLVNHLAEAALRGLSHRSAEQRVALVKDILPGAAGRGRVSASHRRRRAR